MSYSSANYLPGGALAMEMSLYELNDLYVSRQSLNIAVLALYVTLLSGFLVVIYIVGSKLTRPQLAALCIAYYAWAITHLWATFSYNSELIVVQEKIRAIAPEYVDQGDPLFALILGFSILGVTLLLPLVFVWQVRRNAEK